MPRAPRLRDSAETIGIWLAAFVISPWHFAWRCLTRPRVNRQQRAKLVVRSAHLNGSRWVGSLGAARGERALDLSSLVSAKWFVLTHTNDGFDNPDEYDLLELELQSGERMVLEADEGGPLKELVVELQARGLVRTKPRELQLNVGGFADMFLIIAWVLFFVFASVLWEHHRR